MEKVASIKFLGIIISETLTWDDHIKSLNSKLSKISGSLFKLGKCLPKDLLCPVYFALINSQLIYGISIWGSAGSTTNLATLFSAQKKSMRTLFHLLFIFYCVANLTAQFETFILDNLKSLLHTYCIF